MSKIQIRNTIAIRLARTREIPAIRAMQERSLAVLGAPYYSPQEIAGFIENVGTMDNAVVDEGHYFVAVNHAGAIMACGGWSQREPGYDRLRAVGVADSPRSGTATVRSVFVDPVVARRGVASALMAHIERDAACHGVRVLRLMSTLSGLTFYTRLGWRAEGEKAIALPDGLRLRCVSMAKPVASEPRRQSKAVEERMLERG
jgi:GNAT superfamily N-acetyltransferase